MARKGRALVFLDSLKEAHLFFLEGMTNGMHKPSHRSCVLISETDHIVYLEAADAKKQYPELYTKWRRTLQISMLMAYTHLGACGEQQSKHGKKSCLLQYENPIPILVLFLVYPQLASGFYGIHFFLLTGRKLLGGYAQIYFEGAHLHSSWSPPERQV